MECLWTKKKKLQNKTIKLEKILKGSLSHETKHNIKFYLKTNNSFITRNKTKNLSQIIKK